MTQQLKRVAPEFKWKKYLFENYNVFMKHPLTRRFVDAILSNDHLSINCWGSRGSGKSTFQRQLSYKIYGNWDLVYAFRVQSKKELMDAVEYAKLDDRLWIDYHGTPLKRLPFLDIDDKGTIFPSSVGNTREMSEWHKWWQSIRAEVAVIIGSSPMQSDVRKRLRIGADAEILCSKKLYPNGRKKFEAKYIEFIYHSDWRNPEGAYVSKKSICDIPWSQLPDKVLHRELERRTALSEMLRAGANNSVDAKAQFLLYDQKEGLMEHQKQMLLILHAIKGKKPVITTLEFNEGYCAALGIKRDRDMIRRQLIRLSQAGAIRHDTREGVGNIDFTPLGNKIIELLKAEEPASAATTATEGNPGVS